MRMALVMMRRGVCMVVVGVDADPVDRTETHAAFGDDAVGEGADRLSRSTQRHCFERRLVIEHDMGNGNDEGVVRVLQVEQARRKRASPVIINIAEARTQVPATAVRRSASTRCRTRSRTASDRLA